LFQVVDFSDPQRIGFVNAFVQYFLARPDNHRSEAQLHNDAAKLLKGCLYHYHKAITRISKMGEAVPLANKKEFQTLCKSLPEIDSASEFENVVATIQRKWPKTTRWLGWWLTPEHSALIFPTQRKMSVQIAAQLPATTNAEEAMHATIYRIVGSLYNPLFKGLDGLLNVEKSLRRETENAICKWAYTSIKVGLIKSI
jgi:hypothetical protein